MLKAGSRVNSNGSEKFKLSPPKTKLGLNKMCSFHRLYNCKLTDLLRYDGGVVDESDGQSIGDGPEATDEVRPGSLEAGRHVDVARLALGAEDLMRPDLTGFVARSLTVHDSLGRNGSQI